MRGDAAVSRLLLPACPMGVTTAEACARFASSLGVASQGRSRRPVSSVCVRPVLADV